MNSVRVVNGVLLPGCLVAAVIDGQSEARFPEVPRNVARGTCRPRLTQTTTTPGSQLLFHICLLPVHLLTAESASAVEHCFV
jgi:hypothetical protein